MRFVQYMGNSKGLPYGVEVDYDKILFKKLIDFVTALNPEQLTPEQRIKIVDIIKDFKFNSENDELDTYYENNKEKLGRY